VKVAFVYAGRRLTLLPEIEAGRAPDTGLLGENHLGALGIQASIHEPRLKLPGKDGPVHRAVWNLRELALPWEVGDADVLCTSLVNLVPLASRSRRRLRLLLFNISFCTTYERRGPAGRRALAASVRSADAVVCFAEAQRQRLIEQTEVEPGRVHTLLLGVDERFYYPQPTPEDGYVLAAGRDLGRDYATFANAVRDLPVRALIVASRRNLAGLELPRNVEVRLDVSYPALRDLYAGAQAIVVPTRRAEYRYGADCSGQTVLLDAMATGRPIVLTERPTLGEYVARGESALTVPPEDATALRAALERVLEDRALAESLGRAARRAVEERHTTRHFAERLVPVLESIGP
jgi:glycosyltransferase involved in cell wall biosynthesis